jgi:hypothetical protein
MIRYPASGTLVFVVASALSLVIEASAQVKVETDPARFDRRTGAVGIRIPDSQTAFPGTNCGGGDRGPTGVGASVQIPFGTNRVVITQAVAGSSSLCIFDGGTMIMTLNTQPNFMTANTVVGNGEDDFLLVFDSPVQAVSLQLLTNRFATEKVTLKDAAGNVLAVVDIDRFTPRNDRVFIGFISSTPFKSLLLDTEDGDVENEGFDALKVAETLPAGADASP